MTDDHDDDNDGEHQQQQRRRDCNDGTSSTAAVGTNSNSNNILRRMLFSPKMTFLLVSFSLGQLGDGLNIFQGIYLVGLGWNEGSVGLALSLMGLTTLFVQPLTGDLIDKAGTRIDRRIFLTMASVVTAMSASAVMFVRQGNTDHNLMFVTKVVEGVASSFINPCLAALTLANFGPHHFDAVMASNILWGHVGSVVAAVIAGTVAYVLYPNIKYCFLVIGASALLAAIFVRYLPQGDPYMGRGFKGRIAIDEYGHIEQLSNDDDDDDAPASASVVPAVNKNDGQEQQQQKGGGGVDDDEHTAVSYWTIFSDVKTCILCLTGFFFHFANANVLLVLGELMGGNGGNNSDDGSSASRSSIPLIAGAIVLAQLTMAVTTHVGDKLTTRNVGRKPLFLAGVATLPVRCALIIFWKDAGDAWLLSTQILDGIGGGLCGLVHPYLVADITFGSGRFNVVMGLTASFFGLGATMSNFFGQLVVEKFGHVASLSGSFFLSLVPIVLFMAMPETMGCRDAHHDNTCHDHANEKKVVEQTHHDEIEEPGSSTSYKQLV